MVYRKTETNLWPPPKTGPEMWECPTNKGSAAALPRCSSAVCLTGVRCTSAFRQMILAFMAVSMELGTVRDKLFRVSLVDECALGYPSSLYLFNMK